MMMFRKKRRQSFKSRMRKLRNWITFSIFILVAGYYVNVGLHTSPGLTLGLACVGIVFLFILAEKRDL